MKSQVTLNSLKISFGILLSLAIQAPLTSGQTTADEYLSRADAAFDENDYDTAILNFSRAIELNPRNPNVYDRRATAYRCKGLFDKAISDYNKAIALDPDFAPFYYDRAVTQLGRGGHAMVISDCTKAIQLDPTFANAYMYRGGSYLFNGSWDKAISDFSKAIELDPEWDQAYVNRGAAYSQKKQYDQAISDSDQALKINPKNAMAQKNRARFLELKAQSENTTSGQSESEHTKGKDADKTLDQVLDQIFTQAVKATNNERTTKSAGRGYLGAGVRTLTPALAEAYKVEESTTGALVIDVKPKSPAEKAGIENGDVITSIDEKKIGDAAQLRSVIGSMAPGTKVRIEVNHGRQKKLFDIDLAEIPAADGR